MTLPAGTVVMVTGRISEDRLYQSSIARRGDLGKGGIKSVDRIGDCQAPSIIAAAIYDGHRYARAAGKEGDSFIPELPLVDRGLAVEP